MGWLKVVGKLLLQGLAIVEGVGPFVSLAKPAAAGVVQAVGIDIQKLLAIVANVEAAGQAWQQPGAAKAQVAGALIGQEVIAGLDLVGHQVADPAAFRAACTALAGAVADIGNALKPSDAQLKALGA